jgi:hypothetical protein
MRRFALSLVVLTLVVAAGCKPVNPERSIRLIEARRAAIDREAPGYRCVETEITGHFQLKDMRACFAGRQLRKLTVRDWHATDTDTKDYYFWEGSRPFFVFVHTDVAEKFGGTRIGRIYQNHYYFHGRWLLRKLDTQKRPMALDDIARWQSKRLRSEARDLVPQARRAADREWAGRR